VKLLAELALPSGQIGAAPEATTELFQGSDEDVLRLISNTYEKVT
jgi:hypothetical protein